MSLIGNVCVGVELETEARRRPSRIAAPPTPPPRRCYPWPVRRTLAVLLLTLAAGAATACGTSLPVVQHDRPHTTPAAHHVATTRARPTFSASPVSASPSTTSAPSRPPNADPAQLPRGGTTILGHYRVVAFYGAPGDGRLGVLGNGTPDQAARAVIEQARGFAGFGLRVQPAMELIATVAQGSAGPDGDYSAPIPQAVIRRYLAAAHRHHMLLILDLQPGRGSFLAQAEALRPLLLDPWVSLALDPEWKVTDQQTPGDGLIGSSAAGPINAVTRYLSRLVTGHHLPDKLLVVHEFTHTMLPDRQDIRTAPGVETVFHADGFGTPEVKRHVYRQLRFPGRPFGAGFKLFFSQDSRLMSPAEVMQLRPRPDMISYE